MFPTENYSLKTNDNIFTEIQLSMSLSRKQIDFVVN